MTGPIRPTDPIEPQQNISGQSASKNALPTPHEFRLPDSLPTQEKHAVKTTFPAFELLDRAARLKNNPAQATFEVLSQETLPEAQSTEKTLQNQASLFLAEKIAQFKIKE